VSETYKIDEARLSNQKKLYYIYFKRKLGGNFLRIEVTVGKSRTKSKLVQVFFFTIDLYY